MVVLTLIIFGLGFLLLAGPTGLSYLLTGFASMSPASSNTTTYLLIILTVEIVLSRICLKGKRRMARSFLLVHQIIEVLSGILIIFHNLFVKIDIGWSKILAENSSLFAMLRYIGIVLIALAFGIFVGSIFRSGNFNKKGGGTGNAGPDTHVKDSKRTEPSRRSEVRNHAEPSKRTEQVKHDETTVKHTEKQRGGKQQVRDEDLVIHLPQNAGKKLF